MSLHSSKWVRGLGFLSTRHWIHLHPERGAGLGQGSSLKLLKMAWEELNSELSIANASGNQGAEWGLEVWMTDHSTHYMSYPTHIFCIWGLGQPGAMYLPFQSLSPHDDLRCPTLSLVTSWRNTNPEVLFICFHPMVWLSTTQLCKQLSEESQAPWHYKGCYFDPCELMHCLLKGILICPQKKRNWCIKCYLWEQLYPYTSL